MSNEWTPERMAELREKNDVKILKELIARLENDNAALREELRESEAAKNMAFEIIIAQNNERELIRARVPAAGTVAVPIDLAKDAADCISQGHSSRYLASALQAILDAAAVDEGVKNNGQRNSTTG